MADRNARIWTGSAWELISAPVSTSNAVAVWQSTAPSSPVTGQIWIDSDDNKMYVWSGSQWIAVALDLSLYATLASPIFTGTVVLPTNTSIGIISSTEIGFLDGVTSSIQTQIDNNVSKNGGDTITVSTGTTVPLTIQNNGTGNSFVVNDQSSDSNPFIIDASGNLSIGGTISSNTINEGSQNVGPDQFFYIGANASGITTVATNPYGISPNLTAYGLYEFEYWLGLANSSTGAITLGWAGTTVTRLIADINVLPAAAGTAYAGVNPRTSTANAALTGGNAAATHWIKIRGFVLNGASVQRLPLQVSVASGTITPQAGSWFKFTNRGVSISGTSNITYGNIA